MEKPLDIKWWLKLRKHWLVKHQPLAMRCKGRNCVCIFTDDLLARECPRVALLSFVTALPFATHIHLIDDNGQLLTETIEFGDTRSLYRELASNQPATTALARMACNPLYDRNVWTLVTEFTRAKPRAFYMGRNVKLQDPDIACEHIIEYALFDLGGKSPSFKEYVIHTKTRRY